MAFIDEQIFSELARLTPIRLQALVRHTESTPPFSYPLAKQINVEAAAEELDRFEGTLAADNTLPRPIVQLYTGKIHERRERIELVRALQQQDDSLVAAYSEKLFGTPRETRAELESELQEMISRETLPPAHARPVNTELFRNMCEVIMQHYKLGGQIKISSRDRKIRLQYHQGVPIIYLPAKLQLSRARAARLLTHELEVHALRERNALTGQIKLFTVGADHYLPTEEALAAYFQQHLTKHEWHHAPGFWDAYALALSSKMGYDEVFKTLKSARAELAQKTRRPNPEELAHDAAIRLCSRLYRGIHDPSRPGLGYAREHIYRTGLINLKNTLALQGEDILPLLFAGKVGLHHLAILKRLRLAGGQLPDLISRQVVRDVIKR